MSTDIEIARMACNHQIGTVKSRAVSFCDDELKLEELGLCIEEFLLDMKSVTATMEEYAIQVWRAQHVDNT